MVRVTWYRDAELSRASAKLSPFTSTMQVRRRAALTSPGYVRP